MIIQIILAFLMVVGGISFPYYQYFKASSQKSLFSLQQRNILFLLGALTSIALGIIIWNPSFQTEEEIVIQPSIGFLIDKTPSVKEAFLSQSDFEEAQNNLQKLQEKLSAKYDIITQEISDSNFTNIGQNFLQLKKNTVARNPAAIIIASDGQHNSGPYPTVPNQPVYAIGLGESIQKEDLSIGSILVNPACLLDDLVPIKAFINRQNSNVESARVQFYVNNNLKIDTIVSFDKNGFAEFNDQFLAQKSGIQKFKLVVKPLDGEFNTQNNQENFTIIVKNVDAKIGIAFKTIHPDIKAIRQSLESFGNYQITMIDCSKGIQFDKFKDLDCLIQFGNFETPKNVPTLYVGSKQNQGNLAEFFNIQNMGVDEPKKGVINTSFNRINTDQLSWINNMPPLAVPFGIYSKAPQTEILAFQSISNITTAYPLIAFQYQTKYPIGIIYGNGLYKWKSTLQFKEENTLKFDEFIQSIVRTLINKTENSFILSSSKPNYSANESIKFNIIANNANGKFSENESIELELSKEENKLTYQAVEGFDSYSVNIKSLPQGIYNAVAKRTLGNTTQLSNSIQIDVNQSSLEEDQVGLRSDWLAQLSDLSKGNYYSYTEFSKLEEELLNKEFPKQIRIDRSTKSIFDYTLLLLIPVLIGTIQWYLRKMWSGN